VLAAGCCCLNLLAPSSSLLSYCKGPISGPSPPPPLFHCVSPLWRTVTLSPKALTAALPVCLRARAHCTLPTLCAPLCGVVTCVRLLCFVLSRRGRPVLPAAAVCVGLHPCFLPCAGLWAWGPSSASVCLLPSKDVKDIKVVSRGAWRLLELFVAAESVCMVKQQIVRAC
jgi:hypothetical protein